MLAHHIGVVSVLCCRPSDKHGRTSAADFLQTLLRCLLYSASNINVPTERITSTGKKKRYLVFYGIANGTKSKGPVYTRITKWEEFVCLICTLR